MSQAPRRAESFRLLTGLGLFCLGPLVALALSSWLNSGSTWIPAVAPLVFGLMFFTGLVFWTGFGFVLTVIRHLMKIGSRTGEASKDSAQAVPSGYVSFVIAALFLGGVLGFAAAIFVSWRVGAIWLLASLGYGILLRTAAKRGYLPFPEEE